MGKEELVDESITIYPKKGQFTVKWFRSPLSPNRFVCVELFYYQSVNNKEFLKLSLQLLSWKELFYEPNAWENPVDPFQSIRTCTYPVTTNEMNIQMFQYM